jgi:hypothetical protein
MRRRKGDEGMEQWNNGTIEQWNNRTIEQCKEQK